MGTVTKKAIADSIVTRLQTLVPTYLTTVVGGQNMKEGLMRPDLPFALVYPKNWTNDSTNFETGMTSFAGAVQQAEVIYSVEVWIKHRVQIGEDLAAFLSVTDAIDDLLQAENQATNRLGNANVQAFGWTGAYQLWEFNSEQITSALYEITVRIF